MRILTGALLCAGALYGQGGGQVQFRDWNAAAATVKPKAACASLRALTSYDLSIIGATVIPATGGVPEHCRVSVMVQPEINIEVNLPAAWNGRFYMFGNGGFAGEPFDTPFRVQNRVQGLKAGFATAATDTGHTAAESIGTFAQNRQKLLDFAFRSLHVTAETGKLLVRAYYGGAPAKSYFDGCSQGGRQALVFAQRFPADFDGILAGAPQLDYVDSQVARAYWLQGLAASPIAPSKLKLIADSVYAKCDAKDGLKDGLIEDPRRCDFHPAQDLPRCAEGTDGANCFRPSEIAAIERIYGDVLNQGKRFFPGWPAGAEVAGSNGQSGWIGEALNAPAGQPGAWQRFTDPFLRFMAFPEKDPASSLAGFDIDRDPQCLAARTRLRATFAAGNRRKRLSP